MNEKSGTKSSRRAREDFKDKVSISSSQTTCLVGKVRDVW